MDGYLFANSFRGTGLQDLFAGTLRVNLEGYRSDDLSDGIQPP